MKKIYFTLIISLLRVYCFGQSPIWEWAKSIISGSGEVKSVTTDVFGNSIITGEFQNGTISFDTITLSNLGGIEIFVAKYDAQGNLLWAKSAGGISLDYANSVVVDSAGNIIIVGYFNSQTISFGSITLNNYSFPGDEMFVVKLDADGNTLWAKSTTIGPGDEIAKSVGTDNLGNIIVAGTFIGSSMTFGNITINNTGYRGIFIVKFDSSGNVLWAKSEGGLGYFYISDLAIDALGNIIMVGGYGGSTITFGSVTLTNASVPVPLNVVSDLFVVKYDPSGNVVWAKSAGGDFDDAVNSVAVDSSGNVIIAGYFSKDATTNNGSINFDNIILTTSLSQKFFIAKYSPSGNPLWAKSSNGYGSPNLSANAVTVDGMGNSIVAGYITGFTMNFGTITFTNTGSHAFILKYDAAGVLIWAKSLAGTTTDLINSVALSPEGNLIIGGIFTSPNLNFDATQLTNNSLDNYSPYIAKMSLCATSSNISPHACTSYLSPSGNHIWTTPGNYVDTITNASGCDSIIFINLIINNALDTSVSVNGSILTANIIGAYYQWLDCNNGFAVIPGATNQYFAPTANGSYAAIITFNTCVDTTTCISVNDVSINETTAPNLFSFYPNPVSTFLHIEATNFSNETVCDIINLQGEIVLTSTINTPKQVVNIETLPKGSYFIKLSSNNLNVTQFFVKQ